MILTISSASTSDRNLPLNISPISCLPRKEDASANFSATFCLRSLKGTDGSKTRIIPDLVPLIVTFGFQLRSPTLFSYILYVRSFLNTPYTSICYLPLKLKPTKYINNGCFLLQKMEPRDSPEAPIKIRYYLSVPACLATSSAKFSFFFSIPSPVSKRTIFLILIFAPLFLPTCARY